MTVFLVERLVSCFSLLYSSRVRFGCGLGNTMIYQDMKGVKGAQFHRTARNRTTFSITKLLPHVNAANFYILEAPQSRMCFLLLFLSKSNSEEKEKKRVDFYGLFNESQLNYKGKYSQD